MNGLHKAVIAGVIAGVVSFGLTVNGLAQPPGHPPMGGGMGMGMGKSGGPGPGGGHPGMMFSPSFMKDELKLSDEQIEKFKKLRNEYEREQIRRGAEIKIAEMDLWDLFDKKDVTGDQVEKKVREVEAKKTDLRVFRFKHVVTIKTILTPEQFEKFRSMGMMMFGGGRYGMGGMGMGMMGGSSGHGGYGKGGPGKGGYGYDHGSDED
ncbi:MAG: Spy/CpxP family protein refolding chaperone [Nitrospirota bacterium]